MLRWEEFYLKQQIQNSFDLSTNWWLPDGSDLLELLRVICKRIPLRKRNKLCGRRRRSRWFPRRWTCFGSRLRPWCSLRKTCLQFLLLFIELCKLLCKRHCHQIFWPPKQNKKNSQNPNSPPSSQSSLPLAEIITPSYPMPFRDNREKMGYDGVQDLNQDLKKRTFSALHFTQHPELHQSTTFQHLQNHNTQRNSLRKTEMRCSRKKKKVMMMMMMSREAIRMSMKVHKLENANCSNLMNGSVLLPDGQSTTFVHQKAERQATTYKQKCLVWFLPVKSPLCGVSLIIREQKLLAKNELPLSPVPCELWSSRCVQLGLGLGSE